MSDYQLQDVALSSGSACTSASLEPSYVLRALGSAEDMAHSSLRFGISRFTTEQEIDHVVQKIGDVVTRLRDMSPLWEMVQEGIDLSTIKVCASSHRQLMSDLRSGIPVPRTECEGVEFEDLVIDRIMRRRSSHCCKTIAITR